MIKHTEIPAIIKIGLDTAVKIRDFPHRKLYAIDGRGVDAIMHTISSHKLVQSVETAVRSYSGAPMPNAPLKNVPSDGMSVK